MEIDSGISNEHVLDRICKIYGFDQKIQLARHFNIAASSLQNRYTRGAISYDFIVHCSLETGANTRWLLTGKGEKFSDTHSDTSADSEELTIKKFTLCEGRLVDDALLSISKSFFSRTLNNPQCIIVDNSAYIIEANTLLSDGTWLVDIEGAKSIRELTILPGKKLHIAGGKIPFECQSNEIQILGRVIGVYSEVN